MTVANYADAKRRLKVLYCIDSLVRGGTELQVIGLIERLDPNTYQPFLLTLRPTDPALIPRNCEYLAWDVPRLFSVNGIQAMLRLAKFLKQQQFDIVQTFFQDSTVFGGVAAWLAQVPVRLASCRDLGFWYSFKQSLLMKLAYALMTGFVCNAVVVKAHFEKLFKLPSDRMVVLRNGVDVASIPFGTVAEQVSDIGIVGNMTRAVKRTDLFIKAAAIVAKHYPNIRFHIIGDGHLRPMLEAMARSEGVMNNMVFAGAIKNVANYLAGLQVGVICSDSEGLSNALIEYMLAGAVPIATAVGGNPELVTHEETGLLVPVNDPAALAGAMIRLIETPALRKQCALNARQHIEENYSWQKCLAAHDEYYFGQLSRVKGLHRVC